LHPNYPLLSVFLLSLSWTPLVYLQTEVLLKMPKLVELTAAARKNLQSLAHPQRTDFKAVSLVKKASKPLLLPE
jgi:hypothetical protein